MRTGYKPPPEFVWQLIQGIVRFVLPNENRIPFRIKETGLGSLRIDKEE
jgi:hypothetical protein